MSVMDRGQIGLVALVLLSLAGCAQETRITRVDSGVVTDLSGRWNDTDSRMVAESMVKEALEYPWLNNFSSSKQAPAGRRRRDHSEQQPRTYQRQHVCGRS